MKANMLKFSAVIATALLFGGCSSTPDSAGGAGTSDASTGIAGRGDTSKMAGMQHLLDTLTVYFDFDSSDVRADYREVVSAHGTYLASNPNITVTVEGHCDERGSREYNIALGERRANTVKQVLQSRGATDGQIVTISYGEERPAVKGSGESAWSKNRRAEFVY